LEILRRLEGSPSRLSTIEARRVSRDSERRSESARSRNDRFATKRKKPDTDDENAEKFNEKKVVCN
jgi:hypothetical protein